MEKSKFKQIERKLMSAKMGLLTHYPFYALLLAHVRFIPDDNCKSVTCVNNDLVYLPEFVEELENDELQFVLMHLIMHLALGHPFRKQENYETDLYDLACDIVVNSNILNSIFLGGGMKIPLKITDNGKHLVLESAFPHIKQIPHLTPENKDGCYFTADEVYKMLLEVKKEKTQQAKIEDNDDGEEKEPLCFSQDVQNEREEEKKDKLDKTSGTKDDNKKGDKGTNDEADYDPSCDEELQELLNALKSKAAEQRENHERRQAEREQEEASEQENNEPFDDHTYWQGESEEELIPPSEKWNQRCFDIAQVVTSSVGNYGSFPVGVKRKLENIKTSILDWKQVLNDFVQEEVCDYSFSPPDKRLQDSPFFLPDFNETDISVKKILFAIDCSASMGDDQVTRCYSEIYHAILQFGGKMEGFVGFFDSKFSRPVPFMSLEEFSVAEPVGGGGTAVRPIFEYVNTEMKDDPPVSIVILTDGEFDMPPKSIAKDIPVLWIINNNEITPSWGKIVRMIES